MADRAIVIRISAEPSGEETAELLNRVRHLEHTLEHSARIQLSVLNRILAKLEGPSEPPAPREPGSMQVTVYPPEPE